MLWDEEIVLDMDRSQIWDLRPSASALANQVPLLEGRGEFVVMNCQADLGYPRAQSR